MAQHLVSCQQDFSNHSLLVILKRLGQHIKNEAKSSQVLTSRQPALDSLLWVVHQSMTSLSTSSHLSKNLEQSHEHFAMHQLVAPISSGQDAHMAKTLKIGAEKINLKCLHVCLMDDILIEAYQMYENLSCTCGEVLVEPDCCNHTVLEQFPYWEGLEALDQSVATLKKLSLQIAPGHTSCSNFWYNVWRVVFHPWHDFEQSPKLWISLR